jgi:hypothetical protein
MLTTTEQQELLAQVKSIHDRCRAFMPMAAYMQISDLAACVNNLATIVGKIIESAPIGET